MKVLFVVSGNSKYHSYMPAFIRSQAESLIKAGVSLDLFHIKGKGILGYLKSVLPLRHQLQKGGYKIVHAHYAFCGIISVLARKNEKVIVSIMGQSELTSRRADLENPVMLIMPVIHKVFARFSFDYIIFKSKNLSVYLPSVNYKAAIIPNGVDLNVFKPMVKRDAREKLGLDNKSKIILWIGNKSRRVKGYKFAMEVLNYLQTMVADIEFITVNNIPNHELSFYYNACDVFLLSSISEGSPNVIKEAMACNCPIVSTPVGDVAYIIGNTSRCYISKSFNKEELGNLIIKIISETGRSDGFQRIEKLKLDTDNVARKLIEVYKSL